MDYEEQLQTPEWKAKRAIIIDRDMGLCVRCLKSRNLNVHHKYYIVGRMAWEYPDAALVTLCRDCHQAIHGDSEIPVKQTGGLDEALERLVSVTKGVRLFCSTSLPKTDDGQKI